MIDILTIDVDKKEKHYVLSIIDKIKKNIDYISILVRRSAKNGYHIVVYFKSGNSEKIRKMFDDKIRVKMDKIKLKPKNTLFDLKIEGDKIYRAKAYCLISS